MAKRGASKDDCGNTIAIIGDITLDIHYSSGTGLPVPVTPGTDVTIAGRLTFQAGGTALPFARAIARHGLMPLILSAVGEDSAGASVKVRLAVKRLEELEPGRSAGHIQVEDLLLRECPEEHAATRR